MEPTVPPTLPPRPEGIDEEFAEHVETVDEFGLYRIINVLAALMATMAKDLPSEEIRRSPLKIQEIAQAGMATQLRVSYAIQMTRRFGVVPFDPGETKANEDFDAWFSWWHQYVSGLNPDRQEEIYAALDRGDLPEVRPEGAWDRLQDGVIPVAWLTEKAKPSKVLKKWSPAIGIAESLKHLFGFLRPQDALWHFREPDGEQKEGYCILRSRKPFAYITTQKHG